MHESVYLGERVHYHVALGDGGPLVAVSVPNTATLGASPGAEVWLSWPPEAMLPLQDA